MLTVRRHLASVACAWLLLQLVVLVLTPSTLCAEAPIVKASVQCTCSHGDGQVCPMHHPAVKSETKACSCRSTTDTASAVMASLFGPAAVLTVPANAAVPAGHSRQPARPDACPPDSSIVPDAPPPRA